MSYDQPAEPQSTRARPNRSVRGERLTTFPEREPNLPRAPLDPIPSGEPRDPIEVSPQTQPDHHRPTPEPPGEDQVVFETFTPTFRHADDPDPAGIDIRWVPDGSGSDCEPGVVLGAFNSYLDVSTDRGQSFTQHDPHAMFGDTLAGGFSGDQVIVYVPRIDRFVWYMQQSKSVTGEGALRLAVATPERLLADPEGSWTYWDFAAGDFGHPADWLDFPDLAASDQFLYLATDIIGPPPSPGAGAPSLGRLVGRVDLQELAAEGYITISYHELLGDNYGTLYAKLAQRSHKGALWAGHADSSTLRIHSWPDNSPYYGSADVAVAWWNPDPKSVTSIAPDNSTDWLAFKAATIPPNTGDQIYANYVSGIACAPPGDLWLAWTVGKGSADNGTVPFPQPHVRVAAVDTTNWTLLAEAQVWNPDIAFANPVLDVNIAGDVAIGVAFGGAQDNPNCAWGLLYDPAHVVWYPAASDIAANRFGDYEAVRADARVSRAFAGFGYYAMKTTLAGYPGGYRPNPYYVRFGLAGLF